MKSISILFVLVAALFFFEGCSGGPRQKGGKAGYKPGIPGKTGAALDLNQGENQETASKQNYTKELDRGMVLPPGSKIVVEDIGPGPDGNTKTQRMTFIPSEPMRMDWKETERVGTELGTHKEDIVGMVSAKLKAALPIQILGFILICASLAMFWGPVKVAVGGNKTLQIATAAAGMVAIFAPMVIVGNETMLLVMAVVCGAVPVGWWLVSRMSRHEAIVDVMNGKAGPAAPVPPALGADGKPIVTEVR